MAQRETRSRRRLVRLALFSFVALAVLGRAAGRRPPERAEAEPPETPAAPPRNLVVPSASSSRGALVPRRLATSLTFVALFFAGAALSAGAGDEAAGLIDGSVDPAASTAPPEQPPPEQPPLPPEPAPAPSEPPAPSGDAGSGQPAPPAPAPAEGPAAMPPAPEPAQPVQPAESPAPAPQSAPEPAPPSAPAEVPAASVPAAVGPAAVQAAASVKAPVRAKTGEPLAATEAPGKKTPPARLAGPLQVHPDLFSAPDPEVDFPGSAVTIWLHRPLPPPLPRSLRLKPAFAGALKATTRETRVNWQLVLGVLRVRGATGAAPASPAALSRLAERLGQLGARKDAWVAVRKLSGRERFADRAVALARYYRAVGLRTLVQGLGRSEERLGKRVLGDPRIVIYPSGREDVARGRIDVRVLALLRYLAVSHGQVTVSSLFSGHRLYARPGVVSAHMYGHAVDIAALGGVQIEGNQAPGGITDQAVEDILLLPRELQPRQVISLLGLGGPSIPLADHGDHIHVGY